MPAEQRLGRDGHGWFACSKAAISEGEALEFGYETKFFVILDTPSFPLIAAA